MKKTSIFLLGILAVVLNSCVYSLFPIYTEDTLVFKDELLGKWTAGDNQYLVFEILNSKNDQKTSQKEEYKYTIKISDSFTMSSNDPISMVIDGDTTYDENIIRQEMQRRVAEATNENSEESTDDELLEEIEENIKKNDKLKSVEYEGSIAVFGEKSYKMTLFEDDEITEEFTAHLTQIGEDLFLDLYPIAQYSSNSFSVNFFPVHTFFKVDLATDSLTITSFDLDKLNKLFESNLIRLRHENVEGNIIITAQPRELQKFFDKYSDDENVYEDPVSYERVAL
jgi:hypothetical protein